MLMELSAPGMRLGYEEEAEAMINFAADAA